MGKRKSGISAPQYGRKSAPSNAPQYGSKSASPKVVTELKKIPSLGLGYAASHVGMTVSHTVVAGHIVNYVSSACSCGGENPNCFRCDGTGYYVMERVGNEVAVAVSGKRKAGKSRGRTLPTETSFSNDTRGGSYSIRESGRFVSNPVHDDYDDESTS